MKRIIVRGMKDLDDDLILSVLSDKTDGSKRLGALRRFWDTTLSILGKIGYGLLITIGVILSVVLSLSAWVAPIALIVWLVIYFAFPGVLERNDKPEEEDLPIEERQAQAIGAVLQNMQPLDALTAVIKSGYPIVVTYDGVDRLAHPYRLGRNPKTGNVLLRVWEESKAGQPIRGFRTYAVSKIERATPIHGRAPIDLPPSISNPISNPAARWLPVALCSVELLSQAISVPFSPSLSPSQLPIFEPATAEDQRRILFSLRPLRKIITAFSALFRGRSGLARILSRSTLASLVMLLYHQQADVAIFSEAMTIFSCVASKLWPFYKKELELFFEKVVFHMLGNIGMYKRMDRFLMERTLLETLLGILEKPNALENLFRNYDCDVYSLNITSILFSIVDSPFLRLTARSARRSSSISRTCFLTIAVSSRSSARRASPRPNRSLSALPTTPICSARFCCSSWTVRSAR